MRFLFRHNRAGAAFTHPLQPIPRTAILSPGFQESRLIRVFPDGWNSDAERFRPAAVAGPLSRLRDLAELQVELQHAVIVFTNLEERLTERDRDLLWRALGVPVFEQCLGAENELLAAECEAHDGLHLFGPITSRLAPEIERETCACGSTVPRLTASRQLHLTAFA